MTRRSQQERTSETRGALVKAARKLFATEGFAAVSTDTIVQEAGVSRGALYHQFSDKSDLFAAVFESVEADLIARIAAKAAEGPRNDPIMRMRLAAQAWLDECRDPGIVRIALVEAPAVLGWARWREIGDQYGLALAQQLIAEAVAAGQMTSQPSEPLSHVLLGALREGALYIAAAKNDHARKGVSAIIDKLISSLREP